MRSHEHDARGAIAEVEGLHQRWSPWVWARFAAIFFLGILPGMGTLLQLWAPALVISPLLFWALVLAPSVLVEACEPEEWDWDIGAAWAAKFSDRKGWLVEGGGTRGPMGELPRRAIAHLCE